MDGKELFLMIEAISNEKNITKEDVLESLEEALAVATKKRSNIEVRVEVDRHTGEFKTFRQWQVIEDGEEFVDESLIVGWAKFVSDEPSNSIADFSMASSKNSKILNSAFEFLGSAGIGISVTWESSASIFFCLLL